MFFSLPLQNTIDKLDSLGMPMSEHDTVLPDPELFILLDGQLTGGLTKLSGCQ